MRNGREDWRRKRKEEKERGGEGRGRTKAVYITVPVAEKTVITEDEISPLPVLPKVPLFDQ